MYPESIQVCDLAGYLFDCDLNPQTILVQSAYVAYRLHTDEDAYVNVSDDA